MVVKRSEGESGMYGDCISGMEPCRLYKAFSTAAAGITNLRFDKGHVASRFAHVHVPSFAGETG